MTGVSAVMSSYGASENPALAFDFASPPPQTLASASFNGSSQSLQIATNAAFTYGTTDFTVEFWANQTATNGVQGIWRNSTGDTLNSVGYWTIQQPGGRITITIGNGVTSDVILSNSAIAINTWHHYAFVRSGNVFTLYVDGVAQTSTLTSSINLPAQASFMQIGNAGGLYAGRISNFRIVNGTAVYTSNFDLSLANTITAITNTVLLLPLSSTPFADISSSPKAITNIGTVTTSTTNFYWADSVNNIVATINASPLYTGNFGGGINFTEAITTYVDVPTSRSPGGGFTISLAANIAASTGAHYNAIFCSNIVSRSGNGIMSRHWVGDGLEFGHTSNWQSAGFQTMGQLAWYDYVYSANGTTVTLYKNGSQIGTGTLSGAVTGWLNPLRFGGDEVAIASKNTMATGVLYRMKHQKTALSAGEVTTQFNAVRAIYGL